MWKKFIDFWVTGMPGLKPMMLDDEINTELKHLKTQTKVELEKLGRKIGIELDKRQTKDKLIKQIKKACK